MFFFEDFLNFSTSRRDKKFVVSPFYTHAREQHTNKQREEEEERERESRLRVVISVVFMVVVVEE